MPIRLEPAARCSSAWSVIPDGFAAVDHRGVRPAASDRVETAQRMDQEFLQHEVEDLDARGSGPAGRGRA
ncbi:MAG: hypothetical protein DI597_10865 [Pseudoxanthomonas spadix]|nr:MAG: hypothetical protein DI597_10865 [Pseudoxanthomonas spadix]